MPTIFNIPVDELENTIDVELSVYEKAAKLATLRSQRFTDRNIREEVIELCNQFFKNGSNMDKQYDKMKQFVVENNSISLVVTGFSMLDTEIREPSGHSLSVSTITRKLVRNYFSKSELDNCCKNTPNFDLYYNHITHH